MKRFMKIISVFLALAMLAGAVPVAAYANMGAAYSLDNGYIKVDVSRDNAGFAINTVEGNLLKKSDNDRKLLYHDGLYDTSFTSFRVTDNSTGTVKDYIFGGSYPGSSALVVEQASEGDDIVSTWSVDGITIQQTISLANEASSEHGMVSVGYVVMNLSGNDLKIEARILMDTALGDNDFATYQIVGTTVTNTYNTEVVIDDPAQIPQNFYAVDSITNPGIVAYSVNSTMPNKVALGHWSHLASTVFDFVPDTTLNFMNPVNQYMTADSAYAMYYDLGTVAAGSGNSLITFYGVYSNSNVSVDQAVSINTTSPLRLDLNDAKTDFVSLSNNGIADFNLSVTMENYASETAADLSNVILAVSTTQNLRVLDDNGNAITGVEYDTIEPVQLTYDEIAVGETVDKTLYIDAKLGNDAAYERITLTAYKTAVSAENQLGQKVVYILLPGSDGNIPAVTFNSMSPSTIYSQGVRHFYLATNNIAMLDNRGNWDLRAYTLDRKQSITIPHSNISFKDGVMDVALTADMPTPAGNWFLQLEWTDAAVSNDVVPESQRNVTSDILKFTSSDDVKYKNDTYGVLAVAKYGDIKTQSAETIKYKLLSFKGEDDFKEFQKKTGKYADTNGNPVAPADYNEILMIYRGEFTADQRYVYDEDGDGVPELATYYSAVSKKSVDPATRETTVDNPITINGCLDFEGGNMTIYYEEYSSQAWYGSSPICCEFDGELLTSDARTSVWKGKAAITKIEQGSDVNIVHYNKNGGRSSNDADKDYITLIWPNIWGVAQSILGMAFKMAYGQFGVMTGDVTDEATGQVLKNQEIGRVISFSASLDLSFAVGKNDDKDDEDDENTYFGRMKALWALWTEDTPSLYQYAYNRGRINKLLDTSTIKEPDDDGKKGVQASVMVNDILFGCGEGLVGLHFKVGVAVKNFSETLPKIKGTLEINTIGDWSFGLSGSMKLKTFSMEATLKFKSKDNIPIPDEVFFAVYGFKPGINVDGCGVCWITGGGGGFKNLYDTIFMTSGVPPLRLIISASFEIIMVIEGKVKMELGLTGFALQASNLKIKDTIEFIKNINLSLDWYPGIDLKAAINIDLFQGVIEGNGYIVLIGKEYTDWFFEMFLHAALKAPKSIPVIGGITLLGIDLGVSTERIWGAFEALGIGVGVTYYWGEDDVQFGTAKDKAKPTFPSLLNFNEYEGEYADVPVYYDEESGKTLYAHFGTNFSEPILGAVLEDGSLMLMGTRSAASTIDGTLHSFDLGSYTTDNNASIVQLNYTAASEAEAWTLGRSFTVNSDRDGTGTALPLKFYTPYVYDDSKTEAENIAAEEALNAGVNANVSWDSETGEATMSFSVLSTADFDKTWYVSTGTTEATILLYNVEALPELTTVDTAAATLNAGDDITVQWNGTGLDELDSINFYLCKTNDPASTVPGVALGSVPYSDGVGYWDPTDGSTSFTIPRDAEPGEYYISAVYAKEGQVNGRIFSAGKVTVTNTNAPNAVGPITASTCGNLQLAVNIPENTQVQTRAYYVTVYDSNGEPTLVNAVEYIPEFDDVNNVMKAMDIIVGGSYVDDENNVMGLEAGKTYTVGVTPCIYYDDAGNPVASKNDAVTAVYGPEALSSAIVMPAVVTPSLTVSANKTPVSIEAEGFVNDGSGNMIQGTVTKDVYTVNGLNFSVTADQAVTGTWTLDGADPTADPLNPTVPGNTFSGSSFSIALTGLAEGDHVLTLEGTNAGGDAFRESVPFTVDTQAPALMLTSPVNGSLFGADGSMTVSGITDSEAIFTVEIDGTPVVSGKSIETLGGIGTDGTFSFSVNIPNYASSLTHAVTITVADQVGNYVEKSCTVNSGAAADIQSVTIALDGVVSSQGYYVTSEALSGQFQLVGITSTGQMIVLDNVTPIWQLIRGEGSATLGVGGDFTAEKGAAGAVIGKYQVADGYYRSAAISYGIPSAGTVVVEGTIGGSVTGGGEYVAGETVTLSAIADPGYFFSGWTITGVEGVNTSSATVSFTMPFGKSVTATASFTPAGEVSKLGSVAIPDGADENGFIPYYIDENGEEVIIKVSKAEDGTLYYLKPAGKTVLFKEVEASFTDTAGHWAEPFIEFCAARGIFNGFTDGSFRPDGTMNRAMFVTVLWNMSGAPEPKGESTFVDVKSTDWYSKAVAWGAENGIVAGVGNDKFAPDREVTREQMCTFIQKYIKYCGYPVVSGASKDFTDEAKISVWAESFVDYCSGLSLISGFTDGSFRPQGNTTRGQCCAVIYNMITTIINAYK